MRTSITINTDTAEETREVGKIIGQEASPGDIYLLTGPLGAGKTCLTQGIARGLDAPGYARSPTFVLVTRYRGRLTIHHADLYRIGHPAEAWDLGLEDIMATGEDVLIVEWADRAAEIFPLDAFVDPIGLCAGRQPGGVRGDTRSGRFDSVATPHRHCRCSGTIRAAAGTIDAFRPLRFYSLR
ncbi:tRNA threonylcarbamoyladenosine biosynthesis protein TsaE [Geodia barretti]|uniref:tRNA threonylcarbamoyladenosine biosynthesis protein TsaE n=1 Tax=Geodia barretti TaxID=519541 RepID=A0AA35RUS0_GEOBA|nr:tRNA threonylcarbamoyladenosine biosynthesis protein TsaE [Geodia barretti]